LAPFREGAKQKGLTYNAITLKGSFIEITTFLLPLGILGQSKKLNAFYPATTIELCFSSHSIC